MKHHYDDVQSLIISTNNNGNYSITEQEEQLLRSLRTNYNIILKSYKSLVEEFDLKSPIDIYILFSLLLKEGYLSFKKSFIREETEVRDILIKDSLSGINIINGEGVCRHASAFFSDIYEETSFSSRVHNCFLYHSNHYKKRYYQLLNSYLYALKELGIKNIINLSLLEFCANHEIVEVKDKNYSYFLDPINESILVPKENNKNTLKSFRNYEVIMGNGKIKTNTYSLIEEYNLKKQKTEKLFKQNIDVFDNFYRSNKCIYKDTSDKIRRLEKGRLY